MQHEARQTGSDEPLVIEERFDKRLVNRMVIALEPKRGAAFCPKGASLLLHGLRPTLLFRPVNMEQPAIQHCENLPGRDPG